MSKIHAVKLKNVLNQAMEHTGRHVTVAMLKLAFQLKTKKTIHRIDAAKSDNLTFCLAGKADSRTLCYLENQKQEDAADFVVFISKPEQTNITHDGCCNGRFINLYDYRNTVLAFGDFKTGIVYLENIGQLDFRYLLRRYIEMKKTADTVQLYIDEKISREKVLEIKRHLFSIGFDEIVILADNTILCNQRGPKEGLLKKNIYRVCDSHIFPAASETEGAMVVKTNYRKMGNKWASLKQGYHYCSSEARNTLKRTEEIRVPGTQMVYMEDWSVDLSFGALMQAMNLEIPEKYKHLSPCSFANLCARIAETGVGSVFFFRQPLRHNNDAKRFIDLFYIRLAFKARFEGSMFVISFRKLPSFIPHVVVKDSIEAHITAIDWMRKQRNSHVKTIGITGSVGKTSTKEMLYSVLSQQYVTQKNDRNENVQAKIGINMHKVHPDAAFYIQEIGGGRPGGASKHSRMISPNAAVVTNIGSAHIGNYGSQEELCRHKLMIADGFPADGTLFLNGDDPLLAAAETGHHQIYFAVDSKAADYYAEDIRLEAEYAEFTIVHGDERVAARVNVPGKHNILNAVCCYAIGKHYNMDTDAILKGLQEFRTSGSRQNILQLGDLRVFADCFNASYESVCNSFETLDDIASDSRDAKKIVVLGELTGLGSEKKAVNIKLAELADHSNADYVLYYMPQKTKDIPPFRNHEKVKLMLGESALKSWIYQNVKAGDVLLFKGSSKVRLDEAIDTLYGTNLSDERYIDESLVQRVESKACTYHVFEYYATVVSSFSRKADLKLKSKIYGKTVKKISNDAFSDMETMERVSLPEQVLHIGDRAFYRCNRLNAVENTAAIEYIGKEAFAGNESLQQISFGDKLFYIGDNAFEGCTSLKSVRLPKNILYVGAGAFRGCSGLETVYIEGNPVIAEDAFSGCDHAKMIENK